MRKIRFILPLLIPIVIACSSKKGRSSSETSFSSISQEESSYSSEVISTSSKEESSETQSSEYSSYSSEQLSSSEDLSSESSSIYSTESESFSSEDSSSESSSVSSEQLSSKEESSSEELSSEDSSEESFESSSEEQSSESSEEMSSEESSEELSSEESSEEQSSEESSSSESSSEEIDDFWDHSQDHLRTGSKNIDFYNLNDLHGAIESSSSEPGIARISTYLAQKRDLNPDGYVITSSGDMWQGSADSNITKGALIDTWMDYEGFSAMALGNHEFDWTIDQILENQSKTATPFLACNIINNSTGQPVDWVKPYTTITRNGVHIGIIGAIGEGITSSIMAKNVAGLTFDDPSAYVAAHATYLRENGADVILFLYHESVYDISAKTASYVDAIFGGHNHQCESTMINSKPAVEGKSNGEYVSHIGITHNFSTKMTGCYDYGYDNTDLLYLDENPDVLAIRESYSEEIDAIKNQQIAYLPNYISKNDGVATTYNRYAYRYYYDNYGENEVYAVVTNNGRAYIPNGVVTYGDIYKALPFDNYLNLIYAKGSNIKKICSYSSSHWFIPSVSDNHIAYYDAPSYFNDDTYYYVLTIDYISVNTSYASWMNIVGNYMEEEALPRNIVSHYLAIDYPI